MDSLSKERIELAIELIESGSSFKLGDICLYLDRKNKNKLFISFGSSWHLDSMTKKRTQEDLSDAKEIVQTLKDRFYDFAKYLMKKNIVYRIVDDYGAGGVDICFENNGKVQYMIDIPD